MKKYYLDSLVHYYGEQGEIVASGKTEGILPINDMSGTNGAYGIGACEGLDGEITVFEGKPYVTRVRGDGFIVENNQYSKAIFGAWTKNMQWGNEPVPVEVRNYYDLQLFIKSCSIDAGIGTRSTPFPFLLEGKPAELNWHINVNRTDRKPITRELFKCNTSYLAGHLSI